MNTEQEIRMFRLLTRILDIQIELLEERVQGELPTEEQLSRRRQMLDSAKKFRYNGFE